MEFMKVSSSSFLPYSINSKARKERRSFQTQRHKICGPGRNAFLTVEMNLQLENVKNPPLWLFGLSHPFGMS
jgi:hypothetical protein